MRVRNHVQYPGLKALPRAPFARFGSYHGQDGINPEGDLIFDPPGNLYGTTVGGGAHGSGMVFTLTPQLGGVWTETPLHVFNNSGKDGVAPSSGVVFDLQRNRYGTTSTGGKHGQGMVYQIPS
jgi:uncharacterized repeat protein (TIGR03803 family)